MKGFKGNNKQGAAGGTAPAAPTAPDNLEGGAVSGDDAAAALQAQIDGKGGQTPPPPAEGVAVSAPAATDAPAKAETTEPTPPAVPAAPPVLKWFVRAGRSITSPSGVIGEHHEVKPSDIALPDEAAQLQQLEYLKEKGILYRAYEPGNEVLPPPINPVDLRPPQSKKKK